MDIMAEPAPVSSLKSVAVKKHPLENDVILEYLFGFMSCSMDELKTFRLVSKVWMNATASRWVRLTNPLRIRQEGNPPPENSVNSSPSSVTLEQFLQLSERKKHLKEKPQRCFVLDKWELKTDHFTPPEGENSALDPHQRFWRSMGQHIVILTLDNCEIPCSYKIIHESFWTAVPNLERLYLKNCIMGQNPLVPMTKVERNVPRIPRDPVEQERIDQAIRQFLASKNVRVESPSHLKLKSLRVHNFDAPFDGHFDRRRYLLPWRSLAEMFPNLSELGISFQLAEGRLANITNLKILDLIEISGIPDKLPYQGSLKVDWEQPRLQNLSLDCDFHDSQKEDIPQVLRSQSGSLEKLQMYCSPFNDKCYLKFSSMNMMQNLAELQLWGNISKNLDFLRFMPSLRILKWNTRCNDGKTFEKRTHAKLGKRTFLQYTDKIVENTTQFDEDSFRLPALHTLEMDWGLISSRCWERLGKWMPNMKCLTGAIGGDDDFTLIAKQWPNIEHIELAHGSKVTAVGIMDGLLHYQGFKCLKSFTWKPCTCFEFTFGYDEMCAENELRKYAGRKVVIPWKRHLLVGPGTPTTKCIQALYEDALLEIGEDRRENAKKTFMDALKAFENNW